MNVRRAFQTEISRSSVLIESLTAGPSAVASIAPDLGELEWLGLWVTVIGICCCNSLALIGLG